MKKISLDYSKIFNFISQDELKQIKNSVDEVATKLHNKSGAGNDFLGWLDLPINYDKEEFSRIKKASDKIKAAGYGNITSHPEKEDTEQSIIEYNKEDYFIAQKIAKVLGITDMVENSDLENKIGITIK